MQQILVATMNTGKIREFAAALIPEGLQVYGLDAVENQEPVEETGSTFEANARLKAEGYSLRIDLPVLADDSGLEVDALNGEPGVNSARYGGPGLDDEARNHRLLTELNGVEAEQRGARFRCALALAQAGKTFAVFHGVVEGRIVDTPRGSNGFGYDPLFFHPPSGCTTAELSTEDKQRISHRGQAIAAFLEAIRNGDSRLTGCV